MIEYAQNLPLFKNEVYVKVLFIWPHVKSANVNYFMPLGFGYLSANLPKSHNIRLWDGILKNQPNSKVVDEIRQFKPDVAGVSVWNFNMAAAKEVIGIIKENFPELTVVAGGPEPSGQREKILNSLGCDYAFVGEGERPYRKFLELFSDGVLTSEAKSGIAGFVYKDENGKVVCNQPRFESLEDLNYCDYETVDLNGYLDNGYMYGIHPNTNRTASIVTSRGCPFPCEYCSARLLNGPKVRTRTVESVIEEIRELHEKYRIGGFNIIDDNFTFHIDFAKEVCREIIKLGLDGVSFYSPQGVRLEFLDEELLELMKQAGWRCIVIAPESASDKTLKNMRKKIKLETVMEKMRLIKNSGMNMFGFFMIGYPGETDEDIRKTLRFARKNPFDYVLISCFQPLSGTPAYEKLLASGEIDDSHEASYTWSASYAPKGMTTGQLRLWLFWGYLRFYTSSFGRMKKLFLEVSFKRILVSTFNVARQLFR